MVALKGILPAVPTPFTADGNHVDVQVVKTQVERLIDAGVHGLVATGTTGEFTTLSQEEYRTVIKAYIDAAAGRVPVFAGFAALTNKQAVETAQWCEAAGAAGCMIVPPFYDALPFGVLKKFLTEVCASVKIPFMYYNLPSATGIKLTADEIRELGQIKGLEYLKDTSGDAKEQVDMLTNPVTPGNVTLLNGWDTLTFSALALGGSATVWGAASVVPQETVEFWETLAVKGDLKTAREQWKFLWAVSDFLESVNYAAGIKAGCEIVGAAAGPVRPPNEPLTKEEYQRFESILSQRKYK